MLLTVYFYEVLVWIATLYMPHCLFLALKLLPHWRFTVARVPVYNGLGPNHNRQLTIYLLYLSNPKHIFRRYITVSRHQCFFLLCIKVSLEICQLLSLLCELIRICASGTEWAQERISFDYGLILIILGQSGRHESFLIVGVTYD